MKIYDISLATDNFLLVEEQPPRIDGTAPAEVRAFQFFQMLDNVTGLDPVPMEPAQPREPQERKSPKAAAQLQLL